MLPLWHMSHRSQQRAIKFVQCWKSRSLPQTVDFTSMWQPRSHRPVKTERVTITPRRYGGRNLSQWSIVGHASIHNDLRMVQRRPSGKPPVARSIRWPKKRVGDGGQALAFSGSVRSHGHRYFRPRTKRPPVLHPSMRGMITRIGSLTITVGLAARRPQGHHLDRCTARAIKSGPRWCMDRGATV